LTKKLLAVTKNLMRGIKQVKPAIIFWHFQSGSALCWTTRFSVVRQLVDTGLAMRSMKNRGFLIFMIRANWFWIAARNGFGHWTDGKYCEAAVDFCPMAGRWWQPTTVFRLISNTLWPSPKKVLRFKPNNLWPF
jgi:hypothetical protein